MRALSCLALLLVAAPLLAADPRLVVLEPVVAADVKGGRELARTIAEMVGTAAVEAGGFAVVTEADARAAVAFEGTRQVLGCDDGACLAELADALDARFLLSGRIARLGATWVVHLSMFDRDRAQAVHKTQTVLANLEQAPPRVKEAVAALVGAARAARTSTGGARVAGVVFVDVPAGTFKAGDREVPVAALAMTKTEVTVAQYAACVRAGLCTAVDATLSPACNGDDRAAHPVNCVTWFQARDFCRYLGGRLPEAIEWQHAARGGKDVVYPWGNEAPDASRVNFCDKRCSDALSDEERAFWRKNDWIDDGADDGFSGTAPVGSFPKGANALGLLDMAGNVYELCASDRPNGTKDMHGGAWAFTPPWMRIDQANQSPPLKGSPFVGFRCAR